MTAEISRSARIASSSAPLSMIARALLCSMPTIAATLMVVSALAPGWKLLSELSCGSLSDSALSCSVCVSSERSSMSSAELRSAVPPMWV